MLLSKFSFSPVLGPVFLVIYFSPQVTHTKERPQQTPELAYFLQLTISEGATPFSPVWYACQFSTEGSDGPGRVMCTVPQWETWITSMIVSSKSHRIQDENS